jgi:hypothetical protein
MSVLPLGEVLERLARSDASGLDTQAEAAYTQYMHTRSPEQLSVELMEVRHITSPPSQGGGGACGLAVCMTHMYDVSTGL